MQRRVSAVRIALVAILAATAVVATAPAAYAAPSENLPIWRLQIRLLTSTAFDAWTDNDVQVALSDSNRTWVDYGRDDFEAGDDFTYDLLQTNVRTLRDIQYLVVQKTGTDGWCVDGLTLLVNGQAIYTRSFKTASTPCRWVDANDGHTPTISISGASLRANALWQSFQPPARPTRLTPSSLESRVEAIVGDWIESRDSTYKWGDLNGSRYVEVSPRDARTLHVDFDLTRNYEKWRDGEADGDFDMRFACSNGRLSATISDVLLREHTPIVLDVPVATSDTELRSRLQAYLTAPLAGLNAMLPLTLSVGCPDVLVDGGLNVLVPQNPVAITEPDPVYR